jgi:hypothetical protein
MTYGERWRAAAALVCATAAIALATRSAEAFQLKHTSQGKVVKWTDPSVTFVVDPSVDRAASDGGGAFDAALSAWSGVGGAPALASTMGTGQGKVALDGTNTVLFAADGFEPAGVALAVTVLSYNEATGAIVDADIVINGLHPFAVLPAGAQAPAGMTPVSTDGAASAGDDTSGLPPFDLLHVVSHEVGHTLGLGDVRDETDAVMYAFTMPGDAANRAPATDDIDGLDSVYRGAEARAGCGHSSVAGARTRSADGWVALALAIGSCAWMASRRRARAVVPLGTAVVALLVHAAPARSAPADAAPRADATATVVALSTRSVGGILQTTVDLAPTACRVESCPTRARARVWGGTLGGITQQVGEAPAPSVGDRLDIVFADGTRETEGSDAPLAAVVRGRP